MYKLATLNCRSLKSVSSQAELNKLMHVYNIPIVCIQEHCYVHNDTEPDIVACSVVTSTIFTASAVRNEQKASVHGVAITINSKLLPLLVSVKKLDERQPSKETQRQLLYHATCHTTTCLKKTLSTSTINSVMQLKMFLQMQCSSSEAT